MLLSKISKKVHDTWSEEAREKALEARRAHKKGGQEEQKSRTNKNVIHIPAKKLDINIEDTDFARKIVEERKKEIKSGKKLIPIFVNKEDPSWIVDGNHRAKAYQELGLTVPIIKVDRIKTLLTLAKQPLEKVYPEKISEIL